MGGADVFVPYTGDTYPGVFIAVTGRVRITGELPGVSTEASTLVVEAGGSLQLADIDMQAVADVDGTLGAVRSSFAGGTGPAIIVGPSGSVLLTNVFLSGSTVEVVRNAGLLAAHFSTMSPGDAGAVVTDAGGETFLGAAAILGDPGLPPACSGAGTVSSAGYNLVYDTSCGLTGTGDVVAAESEPYPSSGSARLEAVPAGSLGCGATVVVDIRGETRPMDEDQNGEDLCDIGAWEANPNIAT
jgi:hypothetical protein